MANLTKTAAGSDLRTNGDLPAALNRDVAPAVPASPIRLLIVDDDDPLRQTLTRRFQRQGMAVTAAENAADALAIAICHLHTASTLARQAVSDW